MRERASERANGAIVRVVLRYCQKAYVRRVIKLETIRENVGKQFLALLYRRGPKIDWLGRFALVNLRTLLFAVL